MRITHIKVDNFKSLVDFTMPLAKFSCLVGLNGSGKSTVLQFFDFLSQQMQGDLQKWLQNRNWQKSDIDSKLTAKSNVTFEVFLQTDSNEDVRWQASFNRTKLRCTEERIEWQGQSILRVKSSTYTIGKQSPTTIAFEYEGSLLSQLRESQLPSRLQQLKQFFVDVHALDLLAPELMRQRTRGAENSLGLGGERLSAFLYEIGEQKRSALQQRLARIYPQLQELDVSSLQSGWKRLTIHEKFNGRILRTEARHVADGILRMIAIFAQLSKEQSFLLLDEIENGVNSELVEFLMDSLVQAQPQVLVTTHSPVILNYLEDDIAMKGVIYLYKQQNGATQAIRFFDIPFMREKLTVMGPGAVYEDTSLIQLTDEIKQLTS